MDFELFERLSPDQARHLLNEFLVFGENRLALLVADAQQAGITADLSLTSLADVLEWGIGHVRTIPIDEDDQVPLWIRDIDSYQDSLVTLDDASKALVLQLAYYFGESFTHSFRQLKWSLGDSSTALCNMPVLSGLRGGLQLPVLLVLENLALGISAGDDRRVIHSTVETWATMASQV